MGAPQRNAPPRPRVAGAWLFLAARSYRRIVAEMALARVGPPARHPSFAADRHARYDRGGWLARPLDARYPDSPWTDPFENGAACSGARRWRRRCLEAGALAGRSCCGADT